MAVKEIPKENRVKRKKKNGENIEENREAFTFFIGAIVGLLGGASISALFEFSKGVFAKDALYILGFWGMMSTFAGVAFFQIIKIMLIKIGVTKDLWIFDRASILIPMVFVVALIFNYILGY